MPAVFHVQNGLLAGRVLLLPDSGAPCVVGKSLEAGIVLPGLKVAERHALLIATPSGHELVPVRRAIYVDGELLTGPRRLVDGERIKIGGYTLLYRIGEDVDEEPDACTSCGSVFGPTSGDATQLDALDLGRGAVCGRCLDRRLHLDRELASYRILRKIANNEDEITYLAVEGETLRRVAVRILRADRQARPAVLRRFLARALAGIAIDHPNFLPVEGVRVSSGIPFTVVEHLEASTKLEVVVRDTSPSTAADSLYVTNQLTEVLRYARTRDLIVAKRKKTGVLVAPDGWVKVLAYDLTHELEARVVATDAFADLAERAGANVKELQTIPPPKTEAEQRFGQLADEFAEVYGIGRLLFQMLSGNPFSGGSIDAVRRANHAGLKRKKIEDGPMAGRHPFLVQLLERVVVPTGEARIRTLPAYADASKATFERLVAAGVIV
ncbi:MAG: hypothetical protein JKY65_05810 [Planctomycetes bacterium]|nr:hypothetical protein [Planctomycetota bacterium]